MLTTLVWIIGLIIFCAHLKDLRRSKILLNGIYESHSSIKSIKIKIGSVRSLTLQLIFTDTVKKVIGDNKSTGGEIPIKTLDEVNLDYRHYLIA